MRLTSHERNDYMKSPTSAKTSINSTKMPAIFKKITWSILETSRNLDWGGGKYDIASTYLATKYGIVNHIYDPYNRSEEHNEYVLTRHQYDSATMSNVLNVIKNAKDRKRTVDRCLRHLKIGAKLYITVYEGDKSGVGRVTKDDCWQENRRLISYVDELKSYNPMMQNGMIIITRTGGKPHYVN